MYKVLRRAIPVVVVNGHNGPVDGQLLKVGASVSVDLGVKVGENPALEQRIFGKVDASHNVARLELRFVSEKLPSAKVSPMRRLP